MISQTFTSEMDSESNGNNNEKKKDDWSSDVNVMSHYSYNLVVPSFVRLFVIRRIIIKYINTANKKQRSNESFVKQLLNSFTNSNKKQTPNKTFIVELVNNAFDNVEIKQTANFILSRLINDGIKMYMNQWYNERQQCNIIEQIFDKIILKQLEKEHNELIAYKIDDNNNNNINNRKNIYQNWVFHSSDLMTEIFQYLEWGKNFHIDLVNSTWFYHAWNVNSVYKVDLGQSIDQTLRYKHKENQESNVTRLWQRLIHAKYLCCHVNSMSIDDKKPPRLQLSQLLFNKLSMLKRIEKVEITSDSTNWKILKAIMSNCKESITYCDIKMNDKLNRENGLSPLKLPNVRSIVIRDVYFHRIWTNKCRKLKLNVGNISKDWCQFVIKNCDCSSVNNLTLYKISFNESINESILEQLASKFISLKRLKIIIDFTWGVDKNVLIFWQLLNLIVVKNNSTVELEVAMIKTGALDKVIKNTNVRISK